MQRYTINSKVAVGFTKRSLGQDELEEKEKSLEYDDSNPKALANVWVRTARKWLHKLGLRYCKYQRGVYVDGHERRM